MFSAGQQIGSYILIERIGRGGFGEVWLAERRTKFVTMKVAVKLPLDEQVDHDAIKREATLWEEASGHPNVLPIIDAEEYNGQVVIVSEFAPDGSLEEWLRRNGMMSTEKAVETTIQILDGLGFLHSRNIIHRDLKPANILLQGETPRLADFGISRALLSSVSSQSQNISGTFAYMSPEALDGKRSVQTDIWSVGVNLYQFLTGRLPFPQKETSALITAIMMREFEPLSAHIPQNLKNVIAKALSKLPENRYASTKDMREALRQVLRGEATLTTKQTSPIQQINTLSDVTPTVETVVKTRHEKITRGKYPSENFENYVLPSSEYLTPPPQPIELTDEELLATAQEITDKLREFNVTGRVMHISQGPVITTYEYKPDAGVKFSRITGLVEDLCLALKAESIRIDRIPGKAFIGLEIPNRHRETIHLREVIESKKFCESNSLLTIALGKTIDGLNYVADLAKMPHLLIAGATGSGKSVAVNSLIVSILYKARPDEVKFVMVDQKRVELSLYADIPHLATPIITDSNRAVVALKWAVSEMDRRYKDLASWGIRDIEAFNTEIKRRNSLGQFDENGENWRPLPYIVIVIDELAELMMTSGMEAEESIIRLAQMARAVGIHLVLATQKPSSEIITGLIKANFSSRIAFHVPSRVDSRTILDANGAERLLGNGDMLFSPPNVAELVRVHGAFVDEREINRIVEHIKAQGLPEYKTTVAQSVEETYEADDLPGKQDPLFWDAVRSVVSAKRASTSLLQRHLRIGYGRAAAILDAMVREGYVGEMDGSTRSRPVLQKVYDKLQETAPKVTQSSQAKTESKFPEIKPPIISEKGIDMKTISRVLLTIAIVSLVISLGSCVGCYASSESVYSQYDHKYGNPEEQFFFASVMGLSFLICVVTSVTALFCSIADEPRSQKLDSNTLVKMRKVFKIFAITAIFSSVISVGSCVGFIATRPSPKDYDFQSRERAKETGVVFGQITGISLLIFFITLVIAFRNYDSSVQRKKIS